VKRGVLGYDDTVGKAEGKDFRGLLVQYYNRLGLSLRPSQFRNRGNSEQDLSKAEQLVRSLRLTSESVAGRPLILIPIFENNTQLSRPHWVGILEEIRTQIPGALFLFLSDGSFSSRRWSEGMKGFLPGNLYSDVLVPQEKFLTLENLRLLLGLVKRSGGGVITGDRGVARWAMMFDLPTAVLTTIGELSSIPKKRGGVFPVVVDHSANKQQIQHGFSAFLKGLTHFRQRNLPLLKLAGLLGTISLLLPSTDLFAATVFNPLIFIPHDPVFFWFIPLAFASFVMFFLHASHPIKKTTKNQSTGGRTLIEKDSQQILLEEVFPHPVVLGVRQKFINDLTQVDYRRDLSVRLNRGLVRRGEPTSAHRALQWLEVYLGWDVKQVDRQIHLSVVGNKDLTILKKTIEQLSRYRLESPDDPALDLLLAPTDLDVLKSLRALAQGYPIVHVLPSPVVEMKGDRQILDLVELNTEFVRFLSETGFSRDLSLSVSLSEGIELPSAAEIEQGPLNSLLKAALRALADLPLRPVDFSHLLDVSLAVSKSA
jgi:hypothetical protein